jgi:hypothetical protein
MYQQDNRLWDDTSARSGRSGQGSSKRTFLKMFLFIIFPLSIIFVPLIISDHQATVAREKQKREEQLESYLSQAEYDYSISQEMRDAAGNYPDLNLRLAKREKGGIEAKIECHKEYGGDDQTAVKSLQAEKSDIEAQIDYYENAVRSNTQNSQKQSTYCYTTGIGSSAFTHCY